MQRQTESAASERYADFGLHQHEWIGVQCERKERMLIRIGDHDELDQD